MAQVMSGNFCCIGAGWTGGESVSLHPRHCCAALSSAARNGARIAAIVFCLAGPSFWGLPTCPAATTALRPAFGSRAGSIMHPHSCLRQRVLHEAVECASTLQFLCCERIQNTLRVPQGVRSNGVPSLFRQTFGRFGQQVVEFLFDFDDNILALDHRAAPWHWPLHCHRFGVNRTLAPALLPATP